MASGYLNSPEYLQWKYQQEAAMQQQPLYSPFATIAKALQGGLATYGGKKSQAEYDAKQAKNASLLASLLQKQPVDQVASTPSLVNDTGGAEYQSRKDLGAYDQPTSQSPDNSQILAGLLASGNQDAISQYVPQFAQAQIQANEQANQPITPYQRAQLGFEAQRTSPQYLGAVATAQRETPEQAAAKAAAVSGAQLPNQLAVAGAQRDFTAGENQLNRDARLDAARISAANAPANQPNIDRDIVYPLLQKMQRGEQLTPAEMATLNASSPARVNAANRGARPLPPSVQNQESEDISMVQTANNINADLGGIESQLNSGKINLGMMANLSNAARNTTGIGVTPESANYNSFRRTLERLRNDSLRLNKGVQTEGDAQRAWNELMGSLNNNQLVLQRLTEIRGYNERAAEQKKQVIQSRRNTYGVDPLDESVYASRPTVGDTGGGGGAKLPSGVTEDDVQHTMKLHNLSRAEVLRRLGNGP